MGRRSAIDPETRGRLRIWYQTASERYAGLVRAASGLHVAKTAWIFTKPSGRRRADAWIALRRAFRETAWLQTVELRGVRPVAVWAAIKPRGPVLTGRGAKLLPGEQQTGVVINYLLAARVSSSAALSEGLWTAEVPIHTLGRILQRDPTADLDALLLELHQRLISARSADAERHIRDGMVVLAGRGAFLCTCHSPTINVSTGRLALLVRANTWVALDQLREDQLREATRLAAGPKEVSLGMSWFLPEPLRAAVPEPTRSARRVLLHAHESTPL